MPVNEKSRRWNSGNTSQMRHYWKRDPIDTLPADECLKALLLNETGFLNAWRGRRMPRWPVQSAKPTQYLRESHHTKKFKRRSGCP